MKKNFINFSITILSAFILSFLLPWWSIMVAAFVASLLFPLKKSSIFFVPFIAIAVLWIAQSFYLSNGNDFILAKKIAILLPLNGHVTVLILITGIIGGLAAGVSGVFGKQCLNIFK